MGVLGEPGAGNGNELHSPHLAVSSLDCFDRSALSYCAYKEEPRMARLLLEHQCDPDLQDRDGRTAMHISAAMGHVATLAEKSAVRRKRESKQERVGGLARLFEQSKRQRAVGGAAMLRKRVRGAQQHHERATACHGGV